VEELPYFLKLLKKDRLIYHVLVTRDVSDTDLNGLAYERENGNRVNLRDFKLDGQEEFKQVSIFTSPFGVLIDLVSDDLKYFENSSYYFNSKSVSRSKRPYLISGQEFKVKGKRIGHFELFNQVIHISVMQSELYGCKIMLSF